MYIYIHEKVYEVLLIGIHMWLGIEFPFLRTECTKGWNENSIQGVSACILYGRRKWFSSRNDELGKVLHSPVRRIHADIYMQVHTRCKGTT